MKLTLTLHGRQSSYSRQFALRHIVSGCVLASIVFLVSSRSTESIMEDYARVQIAQLKLSAEEQLLSEQSDEVKVMLNAYADKIAALKQDLSVMQQTQLMLAKELDAEVLFSTEANTEAVVVNNDPLLTQIELMQKDVKVKQKQLALLEKLVSGHHVSTQVELSGRPIKRGWLSSYYGMRDDPFTGKPAMHKGLDFAAKAGTEVIATGAGIVTWSGDRYGYGLLVEINHGNGIVTRYGHNSDLAVKVGEGVTRGQTIATVGSTGRSTGAHVHYEVLKHGQQVDPLAYLR